MPRPLPINLRTLTVLLISIAALALLSASCSRFHNAPADAKEARYVVISPIYNEIIWALGAQDQVVGIDLSTTYPRETKKVQTVGYHRALSAEGIPSLHPTAVIHDNNIGPPQVGQQLQQLTIPMKTFTAKNDLFDGAKALINAPHFRLTLVSYFLPRAGAFYDSSPDRTIIVTPVHR